MYNDKIVTASLDGCLKVWDLQEPHVGRLLQTVRLACEVSGLGCYGELLVAGAVDGRAWLYDFGAPPPPPPHSAPLSLGLSQQHGVDGLLRAAASKLEGRARVGPPPPPRAAAEAPSPLLTLLSEGRSRPLRSQQEAAAARTTTADAAGGSGTGAPFAATGAGSALSQLDLDAMLAEDLQAAIDMGVQ